MIVARLNISLTSKEREILQKLSEMDFRPPKDEMRWLLREEAKRRGLLEIEDGEKGKMQRG